MKKTYQYALTLLTVSVCIFAACKKMDKSYEEFIVPGGLTYTGKLTSPKVQSGNKRVKISWLRGADATVTHAKIFWNSYADSMNVNIPSTGDTISAIINGLEEKPYTFVARTYDDKGNSSILVELLVESFGDKYQSLLVTRPIAQAEIIHSDLTINWSNANVTGGAYVTEVEYTNLADQTTVKRFGVLETSSVISDYKPGTAFRYRTEYRPGASIDPFYTDYTTQNVASKVEKAGLAVTTDSFAATSQLNAVGGPGGPPKYVFDDDVNTFWHTHHTPAPVPGFPHWIAVDLAKTYTVTRVELTSRPGVTNGFTTFTIDGSMDGKIWTTYGSFTKTPKDPAENFALGGAAQMKYIRIYATAGPAAYTNLAEFTVFGYQVP